MTINLRKQKQCKNGKISLYLEIYKGIFISDDGKAKSIRENEFLNLFLTANPKTESDKIRNKEIGYISFAKGYVETYSMHQIGENKAELYRSKFNTWDRYINYYDPNVPVKELPDSVWTTEPEVDGWIYVEDRKVFYQERRVDKESGEVIIGEKGLMYDFNLKLNAPFIMCISVPVYVGSIDSALVGNEYIKKYNLFYETHEEFSVI
jgi:hypothetical protein